MFVYSKGVVLNQYIAVALRRAHYELLENGEGFYGSIPELTGVWAQASTLEECREDLQSALEDSLLFSLFRQHPIPVMDGIDLSVREVACGPRKTLRSDARRLGRDGLRPHSPLCCNSFATSAVHPV